MASAVCLAVEALLSAAEASDWALVTCTLTPSAVACAVVALSTAVWALVPAASAALWALPAAVAASVAFLSVLSCSV